jgi:hypothetical protein
MPPHCASRPGGGLKRMSDGCCCWSAYSSPPATRRKGFKDAGSSGATMVGAMKAMAVERIARMT